MTADEFRTIALSLPNAVESAHNAHPDFRVGKRIFATLDYPDANWAMVKLTPEQQEILVGAEPEIFTPANGAWGRHGSTNVRLDRLDEPTAVSALHIAWENLAGK